jgi:RNA polymerase sigma-70 factor (ECF subfamily)
MEPHRPVFRGIDLTPDVLERQGRTLRALARCLLGDAHAAEDVVQETWLACLAHPGGIPGRFSAWVGTVAKHLALRRARGEGRRRAREERAAAPERLEALHELALEREEALRAVTRALLELEEPYKSTLILRFYDERTPSEIAELLGLPLATVKSRLARGLERLRARLGADFAGDGTRGRRALCLLAGVPLPELALGGAGAGLAASTIGGMALGTKLGMAAAVLCLAGGALWMWDREPVERQELAGERAAEAGSTDVAALAPAIPPEPSSAGAAAEAGAQREPVAAEEPRPAALEVFPAEASFPYRITGVVRDERDQPQPGARVFLGPHGFPLNRVAETDAEGRFTVEFDARRPSFDCVFTVDAGGAALGLCELHLVSGQELAVDVGLNPASNRGSTLEDLRSAEAAVAEQRPEETETPHAALWLRSGQLVLDMGYAVRSTGPLDRAPECARRPDGGVLFVDPPPPQACARPLEAIALEGLRSFERPFAWAGAGARGFFVRELDVASIELQLGDYTVFGSGEAGVPVQPGKVRGIVRDARGAPAAGVRVAWRGAGQTNGAAGDVNSDADGAFVLENLPPGEVVLQAGGGDHGVARERLELASGEERPWNPLLERGDEVTGRVVLFVPEQPVAGVLVELWSVSSTSVWCDSTLTNEDGRFAIPNVPSGALELHVYASGNMNPPSTFPIRVVRPVFARSDVGDVVLQKDDVVLGSLELSVLDAEGARVPGAEVRVWQASTGRGAFAGEPDERGKLALAGLPGGPYRVEVGSPFGRRDLGTVWVDPWAERGLDLGEERVPAAGLALVLVEPSVEPSVEKEETPAVRASLWSVHPDVFGRVDVRDGDSRALLPLRAGEHVLCAEPERGKRCEFPLAVSAGAVSGLTLEVAPSGAITPRPGAVDPALDEEGAASRICANCHAGR